MYQVIAIDHGYYNIKYRSNETFGMFESKIENSLANPNLIINGMEYNIGKGKDDLNQDKTLTENYKLMTYYAICKSTYDKHIQCKLVVALPAKMWLNKNTREQFRQYLLTSKPIELEVEGVSRCVDIKDCTVSLQGISSLFRHSLYSTYLNSFIGIIDIGGKTMNFCIVEPKTQLRSESVFSINKGIKNLYSVIRDEFEVVRPECEYSVYEIPHLIESKLLSDRVVVDGGIRKHVEGIVAELRQRDINLNMNMIGIGGGMDILYPMLNAYLPNLKLIESPVYANVDGLFNIGKKVFR